MVRSITGVIAAIFNAIGPELSHREVPKGFAESGMSIHNTPD
jgi:hypothetical protein